jgi:hypothetical protein
MKLKYKMIKITNEYWYSNIPNKDDHFEIYIVRWRKKKKEKELFQLKSFQKH